MIIFAYIGILGGLALMVLADRMWLFVVGGTLFGLGIAWGGLYAGLWGHSGGP